MLLGGGIWYKKSTIVIVILLLTLTIGISFAFWQRTVNQNENNVVSSSCLDVLYTDKNVIHLEKTVPIVDEEGEQLTPYEFTITNKCETNITFDINLDILEETTFGDLDYMKIMLNDDTPELLNTKTLVEKTLDNATSSYNLKKGYLSGKESKTYTMRLWMDENTPLDQKYMNKAFHSKIVVVSTSYLKEIDKTPPVANFTTTAVNGGYLVDARTSTDDNSGISTYYYSKDGVNWVSSKEDNYVLKDDAPLTSGKATDVITSIAESKVYDIYVKVEDNFENMSEVVKKNVKAKELEYDNTIDNNLRYVGASPNNYVRFNNELWRIIGVMNHIIDADGNQETRLKLRKAESYGDYAYSYNGTNVWANSNIDSVLNKNFYSTISASFKNMIGTAVWGVRISQDHYNMGDTIIDTYNLEMNTNDKWTGNIGIIYPSDYGFSSSGSTNVNRNVCLNSSLTLFGSWSSNGCKDNSWLYTGNHQRTILASGTGAAFIVHQMGSCNSSGYDGPVAVYPTLYLKSNVKITGGLGTSSSPFQLALEE